MTTSTNRVLEIKGNLLESDCDVILHQANCQSVMGAGIALQIKKKYPEAYDVDRALKLAPKDRLGEYTQAHVHNGTKPVEVVNLYGQLTFGKGLQTDYDALRRALVSYLFGKSMSTRDLLSNVKFGVPTNMGCGLAGGDWNTVRALLQDVAEQYNVTFYTYTYQPARSWR